MLSWITGTVGTQILIQRGCIFQVHVENGIGSLNSTIINYSEGTVHGPGRLTFNTGSVLSNYGNFSLTNAASLVGDGTFYNFANLTVKTTSVTPFGVSKFYSVGTIQLQTGLWRVSSDWTYGSLSTSPNTILMIENRSKQNCTDTSVMFQNLATLYYNSGTHSLCSDMVMGNTSTFQINQGVDFTFDRELNISSGPGSYIENKGTLSGGFSFSGTFANFGKLTLNGTSIRARSILLTGSGDVRNAPPS